MLFIVLIFLYFIGYVLGLGTEEGCESYDLQPFFVFILPCRGSNSNLGRQELFPREGRIACFLKHIHYLTPHVFTKLLTTQHIYMIIQS